MTIEEEQEEMNRTFRAKQASLDLLSVEIQKAADGGAANLKREDVVELRKKLAAYLDIASQADRAMRKLRKTFRHAQHNPSTARESKEAIATLTRMMESAEDLRGTITTLHGALLIGLQAGEFNPETIAKLLDGQFKNLNTEL